MLQTTEEESSADTDHAVNVVILRGVIAADPVVTELAGGRVVHNFELRTVAEGERQSAPVAWYDPPSRPRLAAGDDAVVIGVVNRRWFRAGGASRSRTEVRASLVARPASKTAARGIVSAQTLLARLCEAG